MFHNFLLFHNFKFIIMATMFKLTLDCSKITKTKLQKGKYLDVVGIINDEVSKFGSNVSAWEDQTKEEKEKKASRHYVGNGNSFWSDGVVTIVTKDHPNGKVVAGATPSNEPAVVEEESEDLPF